MRRFVGIVAILLLLPAAAPVSACVMGMAAMGHEQSACCPAMHQQCGQLQRQECCRPVVSAEPVAQMAIDPAVFRVHCVAALMAEQPVASGVAALSHAYWVDSPPGIVFAQTTILRI